MFKRFYIGLSLIIIGACVFGTDAVPERIVSLAPSFDETLIELGLQKRIVGVTTSSDYLEEVKHAERVGLWVKPNVEKIIALKPDIVLATRFTGQQAAAKKLSAVGIRLVVLYETRGLEEIFSKTKEIGDILGVSEETKALLDRMRKVIEEKKRKTAVLAARPRVYVETGCDPLFTCGKGSFIHELIEIAGGRNIAGEITQAFPRISSEFVLEKDPEVIILPYMGRNFGKEALRQRKGWENISAVKTGRVYDDLGSNLVTIPSPRLILYGLPELLKRIHPEVNDSQQSIVNSQQTSESEEKKLR
jgi:iron complex transport system substrate-binding protein